MRPTSSRHWFDAVATYLCLPWWARYGRVPTPNTPFDTAGFLAKGHQRPKSRRCMAGWPNIFKGDCSIRTHPQSWIWTTKGTASHMYDWSTSRCCWDKPSFAAAITCMFHESTLLGVAWKGALLAPLRIETLQNDTVIFVQHAHFHQKNPS